MKTSGDFHKDLKNNLKDPNFKMLFAKEKARLRLTAKLRRAFAQSSLSIRKMASLMGTSKSQVERILNESDANISIDTLIRFAICIGKKLEVKLS